MTSDDLKQATPDTPAPESAQDSNPPFLLLFRSTWKQTLTALVVLLVLLVVQRRACIAQLASAYLGGFEGDAGLYIWLSRVVPRSLAQLPWFSLPAFYPYGDSLAWSDNFILPSFLIQGLQSAGLKEALSYNLVLLSAELLNGVAAYQLCFLLCGSFCGALTAGAATLSLGWFANNLGHPQLQFFFWIPFGIFFLFKSLERCSAAWGALLGLCVGGAFLSGTYYAIFLPVSLFLILGALVLQKPCGFQYGSLWRPGLSAALALLLFSPFIYPYFAARSTFGSRALYEAYYFSNSALSFFAAGPFNFIYSKTALWAESEQQLGAGLTLWCLAVLAFLRFSGARHLNKLSLAFGACALLCAIFSLPGARQFLAFQRGLANYLSALFAWSSVIVLLLLLKKIGWLEKKLGSSYLTHRNILGAFITLTWLSVLISFGPQGNPEKGEFALGVFRFFYELLPGFNSVRAISRIGSLALFGLCMLAGLLVAQLERQKKLKLALGPLLALLIVGENFNTIYPLQSATQSPQIFDDLKKVKDEPGALIVLPLTNELQNGQIKSWRDYAVRNVNYMNWSAASNRRLINGYSGQRSKIINEWPNRLKNFPDQRALDTLLSVAGLRFIVYLAASDPNYNEKDFDSALKRLGSSLRLRQIDFSGNMLLELTGQREIPEDGLELLVPAENGKTLPVDLLVEKYVGQGELTVFVEAQDVFPGAKLAEWKLERGGSWQHFSLPLPQGIEAVRPLRLLFKKNGGKVQLRSSLLQ